MRIFIAGATGAIGTRLLPLLVSSGHTVIGQTRTEAKAASIRRAGGEAVVADGLDKVRLREAVIAARPEVVIHEMTALGAVDYRHFDRSFATTNRLRTEGLDTLLAAAKEASARRFIAQSYCGWPYARAGGQVKDETAPLDSDPPRGLRATLAAIRHLESAVLGAAGIEGVVLRYGAFYGPGTGMMDEAALGPLRQRRFPMIGDGGGWWSFMHVEDAASATALAAERGEPGIYNIVDDEPAAVRDWLPALAAMLGAKPPRRIPAWLARLLVGSHLVTMMTEARAGTNAKAKRALSWQPARPSWRQGFQEALAQTR